LDFCLTLAETSHQELARKIAAYSGKVSLIEVRLDYLESKLLPELPGESETQFLATNRPQRQGGKYGGSERERLDLLQAAARCGFRWIDLENDVTHDLDLPSKTSVVRSYHSFRGFPTDLDTTLEELDSRGGDVFKIAVQVDSTLQLKDLLLWMEGLSEKIPRVIIGMGAMGQPSRFLGAYLGNAWSYVSAVDEEPAAPGQFSLELAREFCWADSPELYGIIGKPAEDDPSVRLFNRLFQHHGLAALFIPLQLDSVEPWFGFMNTTRLQFEGLSVAPPFRESVGTFVQGYSGSPREFDTLKREGSGWIGFECMGDQTDIERVASQFQVWTGLKPDRTLIREALDGER
jgi:3-dehydroquinate dehydratase/shikimate dehydrogenase